MAGPVATPDPSDEEATSVTTPETTARSPVSLALSAQNDAATAMDPATLAQRAHDEAAAANAREKKAADKARQTKKRRMERELKLPSQAERTSQLQVDLDVAKKKREVAKKEAKLESNKVKAARRRVERVKAKAKILTNNDLFEVYLMRMKEDERRKAALAARTAASGR